MKKVVLLIGLLVALFVAVQNISAQAIVPKIVASQVLTAQSSGFSATTIYTAPAEGLYRVSMSGICSSGSGSLQLYVSTQSIEGISVGTSPAAGTGYYTVYAAHSGDTFQWGLFGLSGGSSCDLYFIVEQLA